MNRKITYLIPITVGDIDMLRATVYLSYIRADGTADIALLVREDEPYNERYYQYHLPITSTLSRYAGEVCTFMQIFSGPPRHPIIAKSSECMLQIIDSKNMDEYISDRNLRLIYEMQRYMEDKVEKASVVYVPHIDGHKVLTFTIESEPGGVPNPVDLNPNDEWSDIGDGGMESSGGVSTYVWDDM